MASIKGKNGNVALLDGDTIEETTVKRRPGRPKGSKNKNNVEQASATMVEQPTPKKRPGRPKGSKNKDTVEQAVAQPTSTIKEQVAVGDTAPKKRRGRPKGSKNKETVVTNEVSVNRVEVGDTAPKKRRGRPRGTSNKNTTVTNTVEQATPQEVVNQETTQVASNVETKKKRQGRPKGSKNKETATQINVVTFEKDMLLRLRMNIEGEAVHFEELLAPIEDYTEKNIRLGEERHGLKKFIELDTLENLVVYPAKSPTSYLSWYIVKDNEDIVKAKENLRKEALAFLREEEKTVVGELKLRKAILTELILT